MERILISLGELFKVVTRTTISLKPALYITKARAPRREV
jgi:hypothetical protein